MAISKSISGWLVDIQPGGRGQKRFRKTFETKREALEWETWVKGQAQQVPEWKPKQKKDLRKLSALIDLWYERHGFALKDGKKRLGKLKYTAEGLGDPTADAVSADLFAEYRTLRLEAGTSANTVNKEHAHLRAMFNELSRIDLWTTANPLQKMRAFKISESERPWLTLEQIQVLIDALAKSRNRDVLDVALLSLATGARWSEAETLKGGHILPGAVQYVDTKSGRNRTVPVAADIERMLQARKVRGAEQLFAPSYSAFREAMKRTGIELKAGTCAHVLRHTFASHFMQNGGSILTLQRILGHSSLTMTMRYAHLAPDHLEEARALNPLVQLTVG